jgi:23S rRNA (adenine2503-C2)-methyltransferase
VLLVATAGVSTAEPSAVERLARALARPPEVRLLHVASDEAQGLSVLTALGEVDPLLDALVELGHRAAERLDLRRHHAVKPRSGVVDVILLAAAAWPEHLDETRARAAAAEAARRLAERLAAEAGLPAVLWGDADRAGRDLPELREGGAGRLLPRLDAGEVEGFLPAADGRDLRTRLGVACVGAHRPQVQLTVELATGEIGHARRIAARLREGESALPALRAQGHRRSEDRCIVALELPDPARTSPEAAWKRVAELAGLAGVALGRTEIAGVAPRAAWPEGLAERFGAAGDPEGRQVLESWLPGGPLADEAGLLSDTADSLASRGPRGAPDVRLRLLDLALSDADAALRAVLEDMGERAFRASQVLHAVYSRRLRSFDDMAELPRPLRGELDRRVRIALLDLVERAESEDGTVKYLWALPDGAEVESVAIPSDRRTTFCVSSQVGCALRCRFCATGSLGLARNLTQGEIVDQVLAMLADGRRRDESLNVVFMGQGEPGYNLDAVLAAVATMNEPQGLGIGARHVTISTAGVVPAIRRLAAEPVQVRLAVSLHTARQATREALMNVAERHPLDELREACRAYHDATRRFVTFEVAVMPGVNDTVEEAAALAAFADSVPSKINLIPYNPVAELDVPAGTEGRAAALREALLERFRGEVVVRRTRGRDIEAACGMLHRHRALRLAEEAEAGAAGGTPSP